MEKQSLEKKINSYMKLGKQPKNKNMQKSSFVQQSNSNQNSLVDIPVTKNNNNTTNSPAARTKK